MKKAGTGGEPRWRLRELIALECTIARDADRDWSVLRKRDTLIGQEQGSQTDGSRRRILYHWLKQRMEQDPLIKRTTETLSGSLLLTGRILSGVGLVFGISAATTALAYTGHAPINVSIFFSVFILMQAVLAIGLLGAILLPGQLRDSLVFGPTFRGFRWILNVIQDRIHAMSNRVLVGGQRQEAAEMAGTARRAISLHGSVFKWVAFGKIQTAALFFNIGALGALLFSVLFSDRAFGWQTTLQVSGETVHFLVGLVALPWSWFYGEGLGFPDLSQIQGSRIVLKEGIQTLATQDLVSWWRFLALGIAFYGILPRLAFFVLGKWQLGRSLASYDFQNADCERIMQRLMPPDPMFVAQEVMKDPVDEATVSPSMDDPVSDGATVVRCLLSKALAETLDLDVLRSVLVRRWNLPKTSVTSDVYDTGRMTSLLDGLSGNEQIAILYEGWMPPIKEHQRELKSLRDALQKNVLVRLVLLGIPTEEGEFVSIVHDSDYLAPWEAFVRQLGDPYLMLENTCK